MSAIFGETLTFTQAGGDPVRLVVLGDDMYARYETVEGYTVVYDEDLGLYCFAQRPEVTGPAGSSTALISSGRPATEPAPSGIPRHLHDPRKVRNDAVRSRLAEMLPMDVSRFEREAMLTFGPSGGLLPGTVLNNGDVRGLTILVTFADTPTTVTADEAGALLNGPQYRGFGNACSVFEYFQTMSTGRLRFTNKVVGPYQLSRPKLDYANVDGLLVPETIQLAIDDGVDFSEFDSLNRRVVDALCIMYAGQTEYRGDLWPHNWVHRRTHQGVRTELYIVTSMGRRAADLSIGTFCHESGHLLLRWPDLYDYGLAEREGDDFKSAGLGTYCVMGAGNHLDRGRTPAPVSVYLRDLVRWCANEVTLNDGGTFQAKHADYDTVLRFSTDDSNEYFLVENRTKLGFDTHITSSGLAVYHCDTRGSNEFQQGTLDKHYQCALLQADGHLDLEHAINQGDGGDLYVETTGTAVSHSTVPSSRAWDGVDSGLTISGISEPGESMTFAVGPVGVTDAVVTGASSPAVAIPENRPEGVDDVIELAGFGVVRTLRVTVSITHTYSGDLRAVLLSPTGKRAILHNRSGGGSDNLELNLNSEPPSLLAPLVGQPVAGSWRLSVSDNAARDIGTLNSWSLEIGTGT
jgi:M6 family metalloprotease-like protein